MNRFRVRKTNNDTLVLQKRYPDGGYLALRWTTVATLDRVSAANLAAELDAWLAGTDQIPELETP